MGLCVMVTSLGHLGELGFLVDYQAYSVSVLSVGLRLNFFRTNPRNVWFSSVCITTMATIVAQTANNKNATIMRHHANISVSDSRDID